MTSVIRILKEKRDMLEYQYQTYLKLRRHDKYYEYILDFCQKLNTHLEVLPCTGNH